MDKNVDYSFMKSGFNILENNSNNEDLLLNISSIVTAFTEKAVQTSYIYTEHSKRNTITKKDIKLCLMIETFLFLKRADLTESVEKWKDIIKNDIELEDNQSEDQLVDGQLEDNQSEEDQLVEDPFNYSECTCELCKKINDIEKLWSKWVPITPIECILKKTIDEKL